MYSRCTSRVSSLGRNLRPTSTVRRPASFVKSLTADVRPMGDILRRMFSQREFQRSLKTLRRQISRLGPERGTIAKRIPVACVTNNKRVWYPRNASEPRLNVIKLMMRVWCMVRRLVHKGCGLHRLLCESRPAWQSVLSCRSESPCPDVHCTFALRYRGPALYPVRCKGSLVFQAFSACIQFSVG